MILKRDLIMDGYLGVVFVDDVAAAVVAALRYACQQENWERALWHSIEYC